MKTLLYALTMVCAAPMQDAPRVSEQVDRKAFRTGVLHEGYRPELPTLYLIGDSTVKNSWDKGDDGLWGWGRPLAAHFDLARINVENQALGGTSSRSYLTGGHWERVLALVRRGDFVIMQFGHNDSGPAGSMRGNGDETTERAGSDGSLAEVHSYGWYLRKYVGSAKARGATPIILSLVARDIWKNGKVERSTDSYTKWAREAAEQSGAPFVDLNDLTATRFEKEGQVRTHTQLFGTNDHTHTTALGAAVNAETVATAIHSLTNCSLKNYLREKPLNAAIEEKSGPQLVVIIGDSTVANYPATKPARGWGMYIQERFNSGVVISNLAANGRSTKTFIEEGRWKTALALKPDYVLIQFGHNDSHAKEKHEATDAATDFSGFLRTYIDEARDAGAVPILVTPMLRRNYTAAGKLDDILQPYADAMKTVAAEKNVSLIDLHADSRTYYEGLGAEKVATLASEPTDKTHFNEIGARAMAKLVLKELPRVAPALGKEMLAEKQNDLGTVR
jgi:lysophospholipase L1-like esterase